MISRPILGNENRYISEANRIYIQLGFELEKSDDLPPILNKVKKSVAGLYIKSDGYSFIKNHLDEKSVTVHKIPKSLKNLDDCCDWIYNTFTPSSNYSLASIAADSHRIVINSSHSITDGGYFTTLIDDIQNPSRDYLFKKRAPIPTFFEDLFSNQLKEFNKNKSNFEKKWPKIGTHELTYVDLQEIPNLIDDYNLYPPRIKINVDIKDLSPYIYDKKLEKAKNMSDFLWTGLCLAISAKNKKFGPFGLMNCMDFRRVIPKNMIDHSFGNTCTNFALSVPNINPKMTIHEINKKFRSIFNTLKENEWFYKEYFKPVEFYRENRSIAHVSNLGQLNIKKPFKDIYIQVTGKENSMRPYFQVTAYTKNKVEMNEKELILQVRPSSRIMSKKTAQDIFDTYKYFLQNVNPSQTSGQVFNELLKFQEKLD